VPQHDLAIFNGQVCYVAFLEPHALRDRSRIVMTMVATSRRTFRPSPSPWPPSVDVDRRSAGGASRPIAPGALGFPLAGIRSHRVAADPTILQPKSAGTGTDRRSGALREDSNQITYNERCKLLRLKQIEVLGHYDIRDLNQTTCRKSAVPHPSASLPLAKDPQVFSRGSI
jgi:hypothetical protein